MDLGLLSTGTVDRLEFRWSELVPRTYPVIENGSIVFPQETKTKCLDHDKAERFAKARLTYKISPNQIGEE